MAKKRPKTHKPDEANPAFIMTRLAMLDSVAFWALKPIERTILSVIEIEHMRHGGVENGRIIVTRRQFEKRDCAGPPGAKTCRDHGACAIRRSDWVGRK
jgi:hypothetical protein